MVGKMHIWRRWDERIEGAVIVWGCKVCWFFLLFDFDSPLIDFLHLLDKKKLWEGSKDMNRFRALLTIIYTFLLPVCKIF